VSFASYNGTGNTTNWTWNFADKDFRAEFLSNPIPVYGGIAGFSFDLHASAEVNTYGHVHGGEYGVTADFAHTLGILDVYAFDAAGAQVNLSEAIGASGHEYSVAAAVPEPEAYALMLAGLGLVASIAHRRKRQSA
jgi:hypothetical protein